MVSASRRVRRAAGPAVDDLIARLEADTCFRSFLLDGQTVLLEDYLRVRPERTDSVRQLVTDGRLQMGPWYVLADELIPSGESLVRNLLAGAADAERLGRRSDVLYSPTRSGIPPLAHPRSRIRHPFRGTVAGTRRRAGRASGDLFRWFGPDGRAVSALSLPAPGLRGRDGSPRRPGGASVGVGSASGGARRARGRPPHVAVFVGADHHAVHPEFCRLRDLSPSSSRNARVPHLETRRFLTTASARGGPGAGPARELRWSYGYSLDAAGRHGTRAALDAVTAKPSSGSSGSREPLSALAQAAGLLHLPEGPSRRVADAAAVTVPRLHRRMHLG